MEVQATPYPTTTSTIITKRGGVKIIRTNCLTLTLTLTLTLILTLTLTLSVMEYLLVWSALQVQVENGREKWSMLHLRCPA